MRIRRRRAFLRLFFEELEDRRLLTGTTTSVITQTALTPPYYPPAILAAYGVNQIPSYNGTAITGAGETIAIMATATTKTAAQLSSDLHTFDTNANINLPDPPSVTVVEAPVENAGGIAQQVDNEGSDIEEDMDIEWAHVMAPGANIEVVVAPLNYYNPDARTSQVIFDAAMSYAASLPGVAVVSASYGYAPNRGVFTSNPFSQAPGEYPSETNDDSDFTTPAGHQGVTFVVSAGDDGFGSFPAMSPNVVAVGGTTLTINQTTTTTTNTSTTPPTVTVTNSGPYSYNNEVYWNDPLGGTFASGSAGFGVGGQGLSSYEPEPAYQESFQTTGKRSMPDVSMDGDYDNTPVQLYFSDPPNGVAGGWYPGGNGGTSLSAPMFAGLMADADQIRALQGESTLDGPSQTLPALYALANSGDYNQMATVNDIAGTNIPETGLGSPKANLLVPALAAYGTADQVVTNLPGTVVAGSTIQVTVQAEDAYGSVDATATGPVLINGVTVATLVGGTATFSFNTAAFNMTQTSSGDSLQVTADGFTTQASVAVVAGSPAQLLVSSEPPATVDVGDTFGVTVTAIDAYGNVVTGYAGTAVVAMLNNPDKATLGGTLSQPFASGVATFPDLTLDTAGSGYTLVLSTQKVSVATSAINAFNALTITGTAKSSVTVGFVDAQHFEVTINGSTTVYSLAQYNRLVYQGPVGKYSKLVFNDTSRTYTASQTFTSTQLASSTFAFEADNVSNLYVYANSASTASVQVAQGSGGNFYVDAANSGYSYIADPNDGIFSQLIGFGAETVSGSGGSTYAYVYSTNQASVVADPAGTSVTVSGVKSTLASFSQLYILGAASGTDQVTLDSEGGQFVGTPTFSYVDGSYMSASFIIGALYCATSAPRLRRPARIRLSSIASPATFSMAALRRVPWRDRPAIVWEPATSSSFRPTVMPRSRCWSRGAAPTAPI